MHKNGTAAAVSVELRLGHFKSARYIAGVDFSTPSADADGGNCGYIMDFLPPPARARTNDKSELRGDERAPILPPHLLSPFRQLQNSSVVKITRAGSCDL